MNPFEEMREREEDELFCWGVALVTVLVIGFFIYMVV